MTKIILSTTELSVSCVVFSFDNAKGIQVCLIKRLKAPQKGLWTLPGGFLEKDESLEHAAIRELKYDSGISLVNLKQFFAFDLEKSDPKHVAIGYYGLMNIKDRSLISAVEEKKASWFPVKSLPEMAFRQADIVSKAVEQMKIDATFSPIFAPLLPNEFTLTELRNVVEEIFDCKFDPSNFRKKISDLPIIVDTHKKKKGVAHRSPDLYCFSKELDPEILGHQFFGYMSFIGRLVAKKFLG